MHDYHCAYNTRFYPYPHAQECRTIKLDTTHAHNIILWLWSLHVAVLFIRLNHCHICSRFDGLEGLFKMLPGHTLSLDVLVHGREGRLLADGDNLYNKAREKRQNNNHVLDCIQTPASLYTHTHTKRRHLHTVNNCQGLPCFCGVIMGIVYTPNSPIIYKLWILLGSTLGSLHVYLTTKYTRTFLKNVQTFFFFFHTNGILSLII